MANFYYLNESALYFAQNRDGNVSNLAMFTYILIVLWVQVVCWKVLVRDWLPVRVLLGEFLPHKSVYSIVDRVQPRERYQAAGQREERLRELETCS